MTSEAHHHLVLSTTHLSCLSLYKSSVVRPLPVFHVISKVQHSELSTMGQSMKLLLSASLLLLLVQGAMSSEKKCAASSVEVEQANTGEKVGYDPVFEVTVRNRCGCALRAVHLRSEGFASSVAVDPRLFRREGRNYLVGDGRRIESKTAVRFRYAWDRAFKMVPASVQDDCS